MIRLSEYLKEAFGCKVYKISLDGGFTCPNRDGTIHDQGCIFCSGGGSGEFAGNRLMSVTEQIEEGKRLVNGKLRDGKYIAYFQAFTGTYASVEKLRKLYEEALAHPEVVALSIATRPDCLPDPVLRLLEELNHIKPIWVELGLQTIHESSARYIRRGYGLPVYDRAVKELLSIGISQIITHVILGLPGETAEMMKETVAYVGKSGVQGIKLQLLHVLRGTDLAEEYLAGRVNVMSMEEYISLVVDCLKLLPEDMVIHRMTGDGDKRLLLAPLWSGNKKLVLNALNKELSHNFRCNNSEQTESGHPRLS